MGISFNYNSQNNLKLFEYNFNFKVGFLKLPITMVPR